MRIALRADHHRWVEWNHQALAGAPLDAPGRFVAPQDGPLSHMQIPASLGAPLAENPYRYLKPYSTRVALAISIADSIGLFGRGEARLDRADANTWRVVAEGVPDLRDTALARLLCRAALAYLGGPAGGG